MSEETITIPADVARAWRDNAEVVYPHTQALHEAISAALPKARTVGWWEVGYPEGKEAIYWDGDGWRGSPNGVTFSSVSVEIIEGWPLTYLGRGAS